LYIEEKRKSKILQRREDVSKVGTEKRKIKVLHREEKK